MINIIINRNQAGKIQSFILDGHALFANYGQDVVCAGASAVSFGAINAVHELTGITPDIKQGDGFLSCTIPENTPESTMEKVQLLFEGMVISLQTIEEEYKDHIKITFKE